MTDTGMWLHAGRVGSPHGLDGSVRVSQPIPELLRVGARVNVGDRQLRIVRRAGTDRRPIVRLEGCDDRSGAQALRAAELLVSRADAPELGPDEWWADDLEGCAVHDAGTVVGTVERLLALPSCEVLEVVRDGRRGNLLIPLISDAVRAVDPQRRRIEVDLRFLGER